MVCPSFKKLLSKSQTLRQRFFSQQTDPDISIKGGGGVNKKKSDFNAICFTKNQRIPRRNSKRKLQSMVKKNDKDL